MRTTSYLVMALTIAGCVALYVAASIFTRRAQMLVAASAVVGSTVLAIAMFQATWESTHGIDLLVVAASGVYTIAVGLAGVLGTSRFLFIFTPLLTVVSLGIFFVVPQWIGVATGDARVVAVALIASGVHWLAALLIFGASTPLRAGLAPTERHSRGLRAGAATRRAEGSVHHQREPRATHAGDGGAGLPGRAATAPRDAGPRAARHNDRDGHRGQAPILSR